MAAGWACSSSPPDPSLPPTLPSRRRGTRLVRVRARVRVRVWVRVRVRVRVSVRVRVTARFIVRVRVTVRVRVRPPAEMAERSRGVLGAGRPPPLGRCGEAPGTGAR